MASLRLHLLHETSFENHPSSQANRYLVLHHHKFLVISFSVLIIVLFRLTLIYDVKSTGIGHNAFGEEDNADRG